MGLTATIIQVPDRLRTWTVPEDHLDNCRKMGIPYQGNVRTFGAENLPFQLFPDWVKTDSKCSKAAGNTVNHLDTTGMLTELDATYNGSVSIVTPYHAFCHVC